LLEVKDILNQMVEKERILHQQLTEKELEILQQDQVFIANIKSLLAQLRQEEKAEAVESKLQAREMAGKSTRFILLTGLSGLLMSGIFLFLILRDIARSIYYREQLENEKK